MANPIKVLILGASYGSLLATKRLLAGHTVKLVCLPAEAELINKEGAICACRSRPRRLVEVNTRKLPGKTLRGRHHRRQAPDYDLVVLAMQEPQYR